MRLMKRENQSWFEGRAVAESAKTLMWRFMTKVQSFHEEAKVEAEFMNRLQAVLQGCLVCQPKLATAAHEITQRMRDALGHTLEKTARFLCGLAFERSDQMVFGKNKI